MEILECEVCGHIMTPSESCLCPTKTDYLYGVTYRVVPHEEEE